MAHNIEIRKINGIDVASFAENGAKKRAWHELGDDQQIFDRPMTVAEALTACHADYDVSLQPVAAMSPEIMSLIESGSDIPADKLKEMIMGGYGATMRTDLNETLGLTGANYGIVQNRDAFKFVDMLCTGNIADRDNTPVIETCGVLGKGERVFVTAKFPQQVVLDAGRDDLMDMYVVITTSHDGSGAVRVVVTGVRCVCNNTLQLALENNTGRMSFRHTSRVMERMDLLNRENAEFAYKTLGLAEVYTKALQAEYNRLRCIKLSEKEVDNVLASIALSEDNLSLFKKGNNIFDENISSRGRNIFLGLKDSVESGIGQYGLETGNAQWLLNGITSYYQNMANFKDNKSKFESILDGNVHRKVQQAYNLLAA